MDPFSNGDTIEADGEYYFDRILPATQEALLEVDGDFGSGTVTPGYVGQSGDFVSLKDEDGVAVTSTVADAWVIIVPASGQVAFKLDGATSPSLKPAVSA